MIVKKVPYSLTQLQVASGVPQEVPAVFSFVDPNNDDAVVGYYRPKLMYVDNNSGGDIGVVPLTEIEYNAYVSGGVNITDFFPISNGASGTFDNLKRIITKVVVSGESGASAGVDVIFQYE